MKNLSDLFWRIDSDRIPTIRSECDVFRFCWCIARQIASLSSKREQRCERAPIIVPIAASRLDAVQPGFKIGSSEIENSAFESFSSLSQSGVAIAPMSIRPLFSFQVIKKLHHDRWKYLSRNLSLLALSHEKSRSFYQRSRLVHLLQNLPCIDKLTDRFTERDC